jgi:hypothetical protein
MVIWHRKGTKRRLTDWMTTRESATENEKAPAKNSQVLDFIERPQRDLNPCCRRERPVSWAGLDDGDSLCDEPRRIRTCDHRIKSPMLYQLS